MAHRVARASFERFQKARIDFATEMLDLASKPFYIDALRDEGVVRELKPLVSDTVRVCVCVSVSVCLCHCVM